MVLMPIELDKPENACYTYEVSTRTPNGKFIYLYSKFIATSDDLNVRVPVTLFWLGKHLPLFYELWREHDFTCYL